MGIGMLRLVFAALLVGLGSSHLLAQQRNLGVAATDERRVALVIGNDSYQKVEKLRNARADARAMAKALEAVGFKVTLRIDASEKAMREAVRTFKGQLGGGDIAVFFFSGHGVQLGSTNYLLPIDIGNESEDQVKDDSLPLQRVLDDLQEQKTKFSLAIIDACRDNPFRGRGRAIGGRGLVPTTAANGQMIIYSAGTGQQALDRLGNSDTNPNGVFTRVFLKEMERPGIPVDRVLKNVRDEVVRLAKATGRDQMPALYDQVVGDFYFRPPAGGAQVAVPAPSTQAIPAPADSATNDRAFWESVKDSKNPEEFKAYLGQFPNGLFATLAKARMNALEPPPSQVAVAAPSSQPAGSWGNVDAIAHVNGRPIPKMAVEEVIQSQLKSGQKDTPQLRVAIKDRLIVLELVAQSAARIGLADTPSLGNMRNSASAQNYLAQLNIAAQAYREHYVKLHPVGDAEIRAEYEKAKQQLGDKEYKARHILVERETEAKEIIRRLDRGEDFGQLARVSTDPGSSGKGGDLGWNATGNFVKSFSDAMAALEKGKYSATPVKTQFGWHVILLDDVRPTRYPEFNTVKQNLETRLQNAMIDKDIGEMRARAKIQ